MISLNGERADQRASRLLAEGRTAIATAMGIDPPSTEQERILRQAVTTVRSAMNWAEAADDTATFDAAHQLLDTTGRYLRETFGCTLAREGTEYYQECPVALAHNRMGMSPTIVFRLECSVCKGNPYTCDHIEGDEYGGQVCSYHRKLDRITEVSLVGNPRFPDNRFLKVSVDRSDLRAGLGDAFVPGVEVNCDRCLTPCTGIFRPYRELTINVRDLPRSDGEGQQPAP